MENIDHDILIRLDENVKSIMFCIPAIQVDLTIQKVATSTILERMKTDEIEIEKLRAQSLLHNWINSVGVIIVGTIAAIFKR
jgi:hypothetical protein